MLRKPYDKYTSIFNRLRVDKIPVEFYDTVTTYTAFAYAGQINPPFIQVDTTPMQAFVIVFVVAMILDTVSHQIQSYVNTIDKHSLKFAVLTYVKIFVTSVRLATRGYGVRFMNDTIGSNGNAGFVFIALYQIILDYRHYFRDIALDIGQNNVENNNGSDGGDVQSVKRGLLDQHNQQQGNTDWNHRIRAERYIRTGHNKTS